MGRIFKLIIEDDEGKTTVVPVAPGEVTIGRMEGNSIRLMERNVSRKHARLTRTNGALFIEDLNSFNGVKINGERIDQRLEVKEGDLVEIGDYHLALQLEERAQESLPPMPRPDAFPPSSSTKPMRAHAPISEQPTIDQSPGAQAPIPETVPDMRLPPDADTPALVGPPVAAQTEPPQASKDLPPFPQPGLSSPMGLAAPTIPDTSLESIKQRAAADGVAETEEITVGAHPVAEVPRLICVSTEYAGRDFALNGPEIIIGRVEDNDIVIEHRSVSRNHAKILFKNGIHKIIDLESANGILVNGEEYAITDLRKGDLIELGHVRFRYIPAGETFIPIHEEVEAMIEAGVTPPGVPDLIHPASGASAPTQVDSALARMPASDPSAAATVTDTPLSALETDDLDARRTEPAPARGEDRSTDPPLPVIQKQPAAASQEHTAPLYRSSSAVEEFRGQDRSKFLGGAVVLVLLFALVVYVAARLVDDGIDDSVSHDQEISQLFAAGQWTDTKQYFLMHRDQFEDFEAAFRMATEAEVKLAQQKAPPPEDELPEGEPEDEPEGEQATDETPKPPDQPPKPQVAKQIPPKPAPKPRPKPVVRRKPDPPRPKSESKVTKAKEFEQKGVRALLLGQLDEAQGLLTQCLGAAEYPPCHRHLGIVYAHQGKTKLSIKHYKRYLELRPNASDAPEVKAAIRKAIEGS